jgi:NAD-dependent deacetylase
MDVNILKKIGEMLAASKNTVVVTGAGISTEAGIPDFRGENGIYRTLGEDKVTRLLNIRTFRKDPVAFYEFYRKYFIFPGVKPSLAHNILAEMEEKGIIKAVVTQNVDNLHQEAGNKKVIPVHGNAEHFFCTRVGCGFTAGSSYVKNYAEIVPKCSRCNSILKPDVVLFGEPIQNHRLAHDTIVSAQLLVVIGSSLTVFPLADFVSDYCTLDQDLIIINKGPTALDYAATVKLDTGNTGSALEEICEYLL